MKSGNARQAKAVFISPDRTETLTAITVPTVILTGDSDLLINVMGSEELHHLIKGSHLRKFPGMGQEVVQPVWPDFVQEITDNAHRSQCLPATAVTA